MFQDDSKSELLQLLDEKDATIAELNQRLQERATGSLEAIQAMGLEIARLKRRPSSSSSNSSSSSTPSDSITPTAPQYPAEVRSSGFSPSVSACATPTTPDPYNGSWLDKHGACKCCGGEIPHGHNPKCDIYAMEQKIAELNHELAAQENVTRTHRQSILAALDQANAPTHHPATEAPHPKPMMPHERILALAVENAEYNKLKTFYTNIVLVLGDDAVIRRFRELNHQISTLSARTTLLDWAKQHIGALTFHLIIPSTGHLSKPWHCTGETLELVLTKAHAHYTRTPDPDPDAAQLTQ